MRGLSQTTRRWQTLVLVMLVCSGIINFFDRSSLAIANVSVRHDLALDATAMGALLSAFALSYAFAQLPVGLLIDRLGPRTLLGCGLALWSGAQTVVGLVTTYTQFFWARIALGVGEAPQFPTSARVVSDWFHVKDRGLPSGVFNSASSLGPAIAPPLLTLLMLNFGWRTMFVILGLTGLLAAAVWAAVYRDPERAGIPPEDLAQIRSGDVASTSSVTLGQWLRLFRCRTTWGMILGDFGNGYSFWLFQTWIPGYLEMERHISVARTGFYAAIPMICGIFGSLLGGYVVDRLAARGFSPLNSRKLPIAAALVGVAVFTVAAAYATTSVAALTFLSAAVFFSGMAGATIWALVTAATPQNYVASSGSIQNFGAYLGGTCSPVVTGLVVDRTGSFTLALVIAAAISVLGAVAYLVIVKRPITEAELEPGLPALPIGGKAG
jgi:MFS family permease